MTMKEATEIIIIDPADGKRVAESAQATERLIDSAIQRVPGRDKLRLLTHSDAGTGRAKQNGFAPRNERTTGTVRAA